jgi:hypothetical protein
LDSGTYWLKFRELPDALHSETELMARVLEVDDVGIAFNKPLAS